MSDFTVLFAGYLRLISSCVSEQVSRIACELRVSLSSLSGSSTNPIASKSNLEYASNQRSKDLYRVYVTSLSYTAKTSDHIKNQL